MAYRVINDGNSEGSIQVGSTWRVMAPHEAIVLSQKPSGKTASVKVIEIKSVSNSKAEGK